MIANSLSVVQLTADELDGVHRNSLPQLENNISPIMTKESQNVKVMKAINGATWEKLAAASIGTDLNIKPLDKTISRNNTAAQSQPSKLTTLL